MTPKQLEKLAKTRRSAAHDTYLRKWALRQARYFFTPDAMTAPKCMRVMWMVNHNELYRKILNDPLYDARCFLAVKEREE